MPEAPHEVLLALDATTGQNAMAQAKEFSKATNVTGIALTKLDGTAKGGIVLGRRVKRKENLMRSLRHFAFDDAFDFFKLFH